MRFLNPKKTHWFLFQEEKKTKIKNSFTGEEIEVGQDIRLKVFYELGDLTLIKNSGIHETLVIPDCIVYEVDGNGKIIPNRRWDKTNFLMSQVINPDNIILVLAPQPENHYSNGPDAWKIWDMERYIIEKEIPELKKKAWLERQKQKEKLPSS